jgi:fermentation-respiration switch protein FrsA (DUF1100 family)
MRKNIEFTSKGLTCKGWLYLPDNLAKGDKAAVVVMAHGFSAVKEMFLPDFADQFCRAGMAVLVFDYRFLGESEGEPRYQILPHEQLEDYRNAITWVSYQEEVDPDRLGIWGTSYSGGHVFHLAAFDKRIKAAVAQVPNICAWKSVLKQQGQDVLLMMSEMMAADRKATYWDQTVNYLPVVAPEGQESIMATPDAYEFFAGKGEEAYPTWKNQVTVESIEKLIEYNPTHTIEIVSPTPLLVIAAESDALIPIDLVRETFEQAGEPKKLVVLPCGHFDVYEKEPWHKQAATAATDWFKTHLQNN